MLAPTYRQLLMQGARQQGADLAFVLTRSTPTYPVLPGGPPARDSQLPWSDPLYIYIYIYICIYTCICLCIVIYIYIGIFISIALSIIIICGDLAQERVARPAHNPPSQTPVKFKSIF